MAAAALEADAGVLKSKHLDNWVSRVGCEIASGSRRKDLRFTFKILAAPTVNALTLPGGYIYINRGLLCRLTSESELAGVLAHEVAHLEDKDFQRLLERQLVFLGLAALVRRGNSQTAEVGLGVLQLLNTLRYSRKQEAQADAVGIELARRAGYDPSGLVEFLEYIAGGHEKRGGLASALETHPPPTERLKRARALVAQIERDDYDALMAIARRLAERGEMARALELCALAAKVRETAPEPHLLRAELYELRGEWAAALEASQEAQKRGALATPEKLAQVRRLAAGVGASSQPQPASAPATALEQQLRDSEASNAATRRRLIEDIRAVTRDDRVRRALTYGQAVDGEWTSLGFLGSLVTARQVLKRCTRWPDEALELCWRESEMRGALRRLAGTASVATLGVDASALQHTCHWLEQEALSSAAHAADALRALAAQSAAVREAAIQASTVLLTLLGSGQDDPLGSVGWTHVAVNVAQLGRARERMVRADGVLDDAADVITGAAVGVLEAQLDYEGALAPWRQRHPYARLLGWIGGDDGGQLLADWRAAGRLGSAARAACRRALAGDAPVDAREAEYVLMRLAAMQVTAERLPPLWTAGALSNGEL